MALLKTLFEMDIPTYSYEDAIDEAKRGIQNGKDGMLIIQQNDGIEDQYEVVTTSYWSSPLSFC